MTSKKDKKTSQFAVGIIVAVVILVGVTAYSGMTSGRWGAFRGQEEAQKALKELPMEIGDWVADKEETLSRQDVLMLQIQNGYIVRRYVNAKTRATVNLMIMVGPTGRVVVHTPEVCFGGKNFEKEDSRTMVPITVPKSDGSGEWNNEFWRVNFINKSIQGGTISFYYGVSVGSEWNASDNPRLAFQYYRYAYRMQVEAFVDGETDNARVFLEECLPVIHDHLKPCR